MRNLSNFAEQLRSVTEEKLISIRGLSNVSKISMSTLNKYLRGFSQPSLESLIKIADCLCCSLELLFDTERFEESRVFSKADFPDSLKRILSRHGLTRYRLQKGTGIHEQSIDDWWTGKRTPSLPNLFRLADYLDCTLDELVGRE